MKNTVTSTIALASFVASSTALAATYNIDWLDLSTLLPSQTAVGVGGQTPSGSTFNLPGYGDVTVTYTPTGPFPTPAANTPFRRNNLALINNGSITSGPDTLQWGDYDNFSGVNGSNNAPDINYVFTFTFDSGPADGIVFGVWGLGHTDERGFTTMTVDEDGTTFGEYVLPATGYAPTTIVHNSGNFVLTNSVTEGSGDPGYFNSDLAVIGINDQALTQLTLRVDPQIDEDGIGFNIGRATIIPEPAALGGVFGLAALLIARRRAA